MFNSLRSKGPIASIVNSIDPASHLTYLGKQIFDDPSALNQTLRDVCHHLGNPKLFERADQTLGCLIASHASMLLSTLWTVLLQMLRENTMNVKVQLCLLKHFSNIANRIAIPQRPNAFRVFGKEIISICGSEDIVGDRQFATICSTTLVALGNHAEVDLCHAILEKLINGVFTWKRSDARRSACAISSTLIFSTSVCDKLSDVIKKLQDSGRDQYGIALFLDGCLNNLLSQAERLCPMADASIHTEVLFVSRLVVEWLTIMLSSPSVLEPLTTPLVVSSFRRLHSFAIRQKSNGYVCSNTSNSGDLHVILQFDSELRVRVMNMMTAKEKMKKILWCPVLSILTEIGLSEEPNEEIRLLKELSETEDPMVRCEALLARCTSVHMMSTMEIEQTIAECMSAHQRWFSARCNVSMRGLLRLISLLFGRVHNKELTVDVLHTLLRAHMDLSNTLNNVSAIQIEMLSLIEHTVEHVSSESIAYLVMCLEKSDVKARDKAISVLLRLCREAPIEELQLLEPVLRGVDFLEECVAATAYSSSVCAVGSSSSSSISKVTEGATHHVANLIITASSRDSKLMMMSRNIRAITKYLSHLLVTSVYDTEKEESSMMQTITEMVSRLAKEVLYLYYDCNVNDNGGNIRHEGVLLENCFLTILRNLFDTVSGPTRFPVDVVCSVIKSMSECVQLLERSTQFDIHFHKRLFSFAWNIIFQCCKAINPNAVPVLSKDISFYCSLVPPHRKMQAIITSSAISAMSISEQNPNGAFYTIISSCLELLNRLFHYGKRSVVFVAHLRTQFHIFMGAMDIIGSTHPLQVLQCSDTLMRTIVLSEESTENNFIISQRCSERLTVLLVSSIIPVLNRSLSFDLIAIGGALFSLIELFIRIDMTSGWLTCYSTLDEDFKLFYKMIAIASDPRNYNHVSGPYVIPPIIRAIISIIMSPYKEHAAKKGLPNVNKEILLPIQQLLLEAKERLGCQVFDTSIHAVEIIQDSSKLFRDCNAEHLRAASLQWITYSPTNAEAVKQIKDMVASNPTPKQTMFTVECCHLIGGILTSLPCSTSNKASGDKGNLLELMSHASLLFDTKTPTGVLCAMALCRQQYFWKGLQYFLSYKSPIDLEHFEVLSHEIEIYDDNVLNSDDAVLTLPSDCCEAGDYFCDLLFMIVSTTPTTVVWKCERWNLILTSPFVLENDGLRDSFLLVCLRQGLLIPLVFIEYSSTWRLLRDQRGGGRGIAFFDHTTPFNHIETVTAVATSLAEILQECFLLSDVKHLAQAVMDLFHNSTIEMVTVLRETMITGGASSQLEDPRHRRNFIFFFDCLKNQLHCWDGEYVSSPDDDISQLLLDSHADLCHNLSKLLPHHAISLLSLSPSELTNVSVDVIELAVYVKTHDEAIVLCDFFFKQCNDNPKSISLSTISVVVSAFVRCEIQIEDIKWSIIQIENVLSVVLRCLQETKGVQKQSGHTDESLTFHYAAMYLLILASPSNDGQWENLLNEDIFLSTCDTPVTDLIEPYQSVKHLKDTVMHIICAVLEMSPGSTIKDAARYVLSIFVRSSILTQGISESILWLIVKVCPRTVWKCIVDQTVSTDTELSCLRFLIKMNQTIGIGTSLVMELHARYTPLLLSFGQSKELTADEERAVFWLVTSLLLHIELSSERHTKPKPHMALTDTLAMYKDFPLSQMCAPSVGVIRKKVDDHMFPVFFRQPVLPGERHWNIHTKGHLLPVLGRRLLAKSEADKMCSSITHMYLHVVTTVFKSLSSFAPSSVSDVFFSLMTLSCGNASLLKHSAALEGTVAYNILQLIFLWYGNHAANAVSSVKKGAAAVNFGSGLFPEPSSSVEFCDTFNILSCVTIISSLFTKGNELMKGAVDVSFVLTKMLSMDLISNQAALSAVVVMSGTSTRREMMYIAPVFTQRLLRELERCMRGSLSFSFGIMQLLRTAFSILSAFPDERVTMKVCEAVWNVVLNEGNGGRRIQYYAHFMLQSIVNMHAVSETQWNILRAVVCLPGDDTRGGNGKIKKDISLKGDVDVSHFDLSSFDLSSSIVAESASNLVESGARFLSNKWEKLLVSEDYVEGMTRNNQQLYFCLNVRNTIISAGVHVGAILAVAEQEEENQTSAAVVYGSTANLLQLTTIASFILKSGGNQIPESQESDRNKMSVFGMVKQIDAESSLVGDAFLDIIYILLREVLSTNDLMFLLLNRFNFSPSSLRLLNVVIRDLAVGRRRDGSLPPFSDRPNIEELHDKFSLVFEMSSRRQEHVGNCWWIVCNILAACMLRLRPPMMMPTDNNNTNNIPIISSSSTSTTIIITPSISMFDVSCCLGILLPTYLLAVISKLISRELLRTEDGTAMYDGVLRILTKQCHSTHCDDGGGGTEEISALSRDDQQQTSFTITRTVVKYLSEWRNLK